MTMESGNFSKENPTPHDLEKIEIQVSAYGRGDFAHNVNGKLGTLYALMTLAERNGWNDERRATWGKVVGEINQIITQARKDLYGDY